MPNFLTDEEMARRDASQPDGRERLIQAACDAQDRFSLEELEEHAAKPAVQALVDELLAPTSTRKDPAEKYETEGVEKHLELAWNWAQGDGGYSWAMLTENDRIMLWRFAAKLAAPTCTITQADVDLALITATLENGFDEMMSWAALEIATDLSSYNPMYEGIPPEVLVPFVQDWLGRRAT